MPAIKFQQVDISHPPSTIPFQMEHMLACAMNVDILLIADLWIVFKDVLWMMSMGDMLHRPAQQKDIQLFNQFALHEKLAYRAFYPPVRVCQNPQCIHFRLNNNIQTLTEPVTHQATLFTLAEGVLPVYTTSLYCHVCHIRYHHNYYVNAESNTRTYYSSIPSALQVAKHFFIEVSLLELFTICKVFGWLSATNCARIYDMSLSNPHSYILNNKLAFPNHLHTQHGPGLPWVSLKMRPDDILNGFFLYSLLLQKAEQGEYLILPHTAENQKLRLQPALQERNSRMEGTGQEYWNHACDTCFIVKEKENHSHEKIQAAVCDGITLGHFCCKIHNCKIPLASIGDHYCQLHKSEAQICSVDNCPLPVEDGYRTCSTSEHRDLEDNYTRKSSAMFQLQSRLNASRAIQENDINDQQDFQDIGTQMGILPARKLKASFGRHRTHNEQIIARPCGIILSRATFYGSEAISSVLEFAKATFPTPASTPEYFIFDSNCLLEKHRQTIKDKHFANTAFPVDVFHFKSKHKITDIFCQEHCNPAAFPEMIQKGKWQFNTSICEQINVWLGGYHAILRDMESTRYNFYLDEMIKRRNRYTISHLEESGKTPWSIEMHALLS
ncbi:hypothetical protein QCA50_013454 [Cerrena zonata]|uniref:CxC5 like cysteine cluster associated with KDZ domain-containing protein n=1 Tax=Cerrena zonata TaxID=2478898 RepID=A0AAW0FS50_9APHY